MALALAAAPAEAAHKAWPVGLDLRLRQSDVALSGTRPDRAGYAATLRQDPWSVLGDRWSRVGGPEIPQLRDDERQRSVENDEVSIKRLLDGTTFPILRIRMMPPR